MSDKTRWRIERLAELAGQALSVAGYEGQASGRVRQVPDVRTIRYYTTLGLIDGPLEMQGRVALYGRRHLLQLVAIKRLQAQGVPLVEVQQRLIGSGEKKLAMLANLPAGLLEQLSRDDERIEAPAQPVAGPVERPAAKPVMGSAAKRLSGPSASASASAFWARSPVVARESPGEPDIVTSAAATPALVLRVAEGVQLLIEGVEPGRLDRTTLDALQPAVDYLREAIDRAGLRPGRETKRGSDGGSSSESGSGAAECGEQGFSDQEHSR